MSNNPENTEYYSRRLTKLRGIDALLQSVIDNGLLRTLFNAEMFSLFMAKRAEEINLEELEVNVSRAMLSLNAELQDDQQ